MGHHHWTSAVLKWQAPPVRDLLWYYKDNWIFFLIKFSHIFKENPKFLRGKGKTELIVGELKKDSTYSRLPGLWYYSLEETAGGTDFLLHCFKSFKSLSIFTPILSFQKIQFLCTVFNLFKNKKKPNVCGTTQISKLKFYLLISIPHQPTQFNRTPHLSFWRSETLASPEAVKSLTVQVSLAHQNKHENKLKGLKT